VSGADMDGSAPIIILILTVHCCQCVYHSLIVDTTSLMALCFWIGELSTLSGMVFSESVWSGAVLRL
jgi:hypothetical protein